MPERNITGVHKSGSDFWGVLNPNTVAIFKLNGYYLSVTGILNSILDSNGNVISIVNSEYTFLVSSGNVYFPTSFLRDYGLREGEYVDWTLESAIVDNIKTTVFPRLLRYGETGIIPKSGLASVPTVLEPLIEKPVGEAFYESTIREINEAHGYGHTRSTLLLLRLLFENQVIDLLRAKYGTAGLSIYYNPKRGSFHEFSVLIDNLKEKIQDFKIYSSSMDEKVCDKLDEFRENANSAAHSIDNLIEPAFFKQRKADINYLVELLGSVKAKIK